ncbi:hypothetical protein GOEFS_124_00030 [Gordonia effusa NBRC 100432]|uniref:Uncharacterized protein n=1 Tax=Gordonia effusa NBRC 100432 TaxID=1077974 RepID=H0R6H0_9ACTN|nr:hypothetical protein [Gordonia effusa]GAB20671.1 hypothetical protein GOEFS_124_00030 [Gordonia effusa NBRC 100432]
MRSRHTFTRHLGAGVLAALAIGGLTVAAHPASATPGATTVDSSVYATPGGHGNFRWRYAAGTGHECRISPVGRSLAVECEAQPSAVRLLGRNVTATTYDTTWSAARRIAPNHEISVEGITCVVGDHASIACKTRSARFTIVGGAVKH